MISIRAFNTHPQHRISSRGTLFVARSVFRYEDIHSAHVNIIFTNDIRMIRLNGTFLNKWRRTDVLSFPLNANGENIEGEVYVGIDQARRQARDYNVSYKNEYARLVIHGLLHLIGYRDNTIPKKKSMKRREDSILRKIAKRRYVL
jgi:probable rRNA maturation factor